MPQTNRRKLIGAIFFITMRCMQEHTSQSYRQRKQKVLTFRYIQRLAEVCGLPPRIRGQSMDKFDKQIHDSFNKGQTYNDRSP